MLHVYFYLYTLSLALRRNINQLGQITTCNARQGFNVYHCMVRYIELDYQVIGKRLSQYLDQQLDLSYTIRTLLPNVSRMSCLLNE